MKVNQKPVVSFFILFVLIFSQFAAPQPAYAASIIRVVPGGSTSAGCGDTWANACGLQYALTSVAIAGDEIWVAQGVYKPTTTSDPDIYFTIVNGVSVYGGFNGTESNLADRNPSLYETVLSGDIGTPGDNTDNTHHVVVAVDITLLTLLDGFTVSGGYSDSGSSTWGSTGAGIYISHSNQNLKLSRITVDSNFAFNGGGIGAFVSNPVLEKVIIKNNTAGQYGGGYYNQDGSPTLLDVVFDNNQTVEAASPGGGMHSTNHDPATYTVIPILTNVTFVNNRAQRGGGGALFNRESDAILTNVTFSGNSAYVRGGAMLNEGADVKLYNVTFNGNTAPAGSGGAMRNIYAGAVASDPKIWNTIFWGDGTEEVVTDAGNSVEINYSIVQGGCPTGATCTNVLNSDPVLQALANNGGFTNTMALGTGSAAIDAGNAATPGSGNGACAATDQRGIPRPQPLGGVCDMGAYEYDAVPTITNRSPAPGSTGVAVDTNVTVTFSEPMNAATITGTTFTLRANGAGSDVPATVSYANKVATLDPTSDLTPGTMYNVTVASTVADLTGNTLGSNDTWSFTTLSAGGSYTDTTSADFNAGTVGACIVDAGTGDGAVKLNLPSTSCVFESRIFDAGNPFDWTTLTSTSTLPSGTSISFKVRTGNATIPDATWTGWQSVNSGTFTNPGSRYIQYQATLTTSDTGVTPILEDVTINYVAGTISTLGLPDGGPLTSWDKNFTWTGVNGATWYLLEVYNGSTRLLYKWYTSTQTNCDADTSCSVTPASTDLNLGNGAYQWRVLDYGAYGYGIWPYFKTFSLNAACYTLTWGVTPALSGSVSVPPTSCTGGYTDGTVVQLKAVPGTGYKFSSWSGGVNGTSNPTTIVMDGNKSVTAIMRGNTPIAPSSAIPSEPVINWDNTFRWTGLSDATWYLIEAYTSGGTQVFYKWYTSTQTGCAGGTDCSVLATGLNLADGNYKWRVLDYGAYGYGIFSAYKDFTLSGVACYKLTWNVNPSGSGYVTLPAQTCADGYTAGSVIKLTAVPYTGYLFKDWSGAAGGTSNPVSVTMNSDKSVTANFKATPVLNSPSGTLGSWNNTFSWTGLPNATWYLLEVYTSGGTQVLYKWYTSTQTGCTGGTNCSVVPPETAGLSGSYKWRILDYGAYGYGTFTQYTNFSVP